MKTKNNEKEHRLTRRSFFKESAAGFLGAGLGLSGAAGSASAAADGPAQDLPADTLRIKDYRILGRTGFKVSDISCGSMMDEYLLRHALQAGMNYLDTAEEYPGHHRIVARAIKGFDRNSLFITTKLEVQNDKTKAGFIRRTRQALEELQAEYVDCLMMHMPERAETLKTEGFHEAMQELKTEGRVKYVGVSNHGSFWFKDPEETMEKVLTAAADDGRFDVFLVAYNFLRYDQSEKVLELARRKNIGVALMKTMPVAIYESLRDRVEAAEKKGQSVHPLYVEGVKRYKEKFEAAQEFIKKYNLTNPQEIKEAAIKFVLGNPNVSTACLRAKNYNELDSFIKLSGSRLDVPAQSKLDAYREGCGNLYCRHACGICEPSCPHGVPINTIMRYQQYFAGQGREKEAMELDAAIPGIRADACFDCPGPCEKACPYGVPVQGMLLVAHETLLL